jgi:hypothetical protein
MPTKKVKTTDVLSKAAVAPKAAVVTAKPVVTSAAQPRAKAAVSTHKTRTTSAAVPATITAQQIADLAYYLWLDRGCPAGTSEADWFKAESELRTKAAVV